MKTDILRFSALLLLILLQLSGCNPKSQEKQPDTKEDSIPLFALVNPDSSNVHFRNELTEGPNTNVLMYEYLYNGGGVAAGDLNNDGLADLYFTSNMGENRCYLNLGNMKFRDITEIAGIGGRKGPWKTGITCADVNGDGRLDLYLCYSGALPPEKRTNQLFINKGNNGEGVPLFEESAAAYGLASAAFSNQGYFFDYDRDGDLDMVLLNHNPKSLPVLNVASTKSFLDKDDPLQGIRLYRQQDGRFTDVTVSAGISGSALTYGLGIGISDLDNDGWPDFYVSNDYAIPDYLYINQKNGTFKNRLPEQLGHTSHFSMGNDIADVNNDGLQDIFTLDMLPEDNRRQKLLLSPDNYDKFNLNVRSGFHYQYMRNMLQLNTGEGGFSEIGQLAGISNTDWSWAALLADYNNDGWKDLFITNGYYRDYTNLDFINYMEDYVQAKGRLVRDDVLEIVGKMPSSNLTNYMFANRGDGTFRNQTSQFGLDQPANSNGAAYADLDNDGDLDLIVNNINKPAFLYRNNLSVGQNRFLHVKLEGAGGNTQGVGARVTLYQGNSRQSVEQIPTRGYLSTVSGILHFGMGNLPAVDSVVVRWNRGGSQTLTSVASNQQIVLHEEDATGKQSMPSNELPLFREVPSPVNHTTARSPINDFKRQSLLISQYSHNAPCMVKGDLNLDGLEDVFIGGTKGQAGAIYLQRAGGSFSRKEVADLSADKGQHDSNAALFDANGDGFPDLYVGSGGYHDFDADDPMLQDRLYLGDGTGALKRDRAALPQLYGSTSAIAVEDINDDGSPDLFVGGRVVPGRYPELPQHFFLINDGKGRFSDQTQMLAPGLEGMVTDAMWLDLNNDGRKELVVVGEWMPVLVYGLSDGKLVDQTTDFLDGEYRGWWNTIESADYNNDGRPDLVVGNMGANTQFEVSPREPAELYYSDFDQNGSVDPIFSFYIQGRSYPYVTRDELLGQLAYLRSKFTTYESYADATLTDIFTEAQLESSQRLWANHMETTLFLSQADGRYQKANLPRQTQYSPVYKAGSGDFNSDGNQDIFLFGNNEFFKLRLGRFDANYGTLLLGDGKGNFEYLDPARSGLFVKGDVRSIVRIGDTILLGIYGDTVKALKVNTPKNNTDEKAVSK